jgi:anti-anti-sigma regulatory factor
MPKPLDSRARPGVMTLLLDGGRETDGVGEVGRPMVEAGSEPLLSVTLLTRGATCRLLLHGALRDCSIAVLEAQVDQLGRTPCATVVIDVRELTEMDQVGANVIVGLHHYVVARGGRLWIEGPSDAVAHVLDSVAGPLIPIMGRAD